VDRLRSAKGLKRRGVNQPVDHHDCDEDQATVVLAADDEAPDRSVERAERALLVRAALRSLSEACRELIQFRFHEGLTYARIAEMQGKKVNTVLEERDPNDPRDGKDNETPTEDGQAGAFRKISGERSPGRC
jgi:RNA polymerase sigma factor (sigma-70 family)